MIKGFCHLWLINSWYTIFSDQVRILITSGLYDACEEISIGCIGDAMQTKYLEKYFILAYPKLKIKYHSENPKDYEFPTLRLIVADKGDYAGFYFHGKGVTKPTETDVNHWRAVLNERVISDWRTHYEKICAGYDVSSINYLTRPDHFSGNYWWFKRKYIDKLPPIDALDLDNRWHSEQWIAMGHGKMYAPPFREPGDTIIRIKTK